MSENGGIIAWTKEHTYEATHGVSPKETYAGDVVYSITSNGTVIPVIYGVYPRIDRDFKGIIQINRASDLSSSLKIAPTNRMEGEIEVYGAGDTTLSSNLTVRIHDHLNSLISIPPRNRMAVLADIQPIPRIEETLYPIKDAFYRNDVPRINYGREHAMTVGRIANSPYSSDGQAVFRSILQFDLSHLPKNVEIEKATLRLYATKPLVEQFFKVFNNLRDWVEDTVSWVNQPPVTEEYVEGSSNEGNSYIEIDVKDLVQRWTEFKEPNYGFQIHSFDENLTVSQSFYTREYSDVSYRPQLEIRYFDRDLIFSIGRVPLYSSIIVKQNKNRDLRARITIKSHIGNSPLSGSIVVVNPNYRTGNITISRSKLHGYLPVRKETPEGLRGKVIISNERVSDSEGILTVNKRQLPSKLIVSHTVEVPADVIVANTKYSNLNGTVEIIRSGAIGKITVKHDNSLPSVVSIPKYTFNDFASSVEVNRDYIICDMDVLAQRSLDSKIIVSRYKIDDRFTGKLEVMDSQRLIGRIEVIRSSHLSSTLDVNSGNMHGKIYIPDERARDLTSYVAVLNKVQDDRFVGEIIIKEREALDSLITVKETKTLKGRIEVLRANYLDATLTTASPYLPSVIYIPERGIFQFDGDMIVNVRMINELKSSIKVENPRILPCTITVSEKGESKTLYAFIL